MTRWMRALLFSASLVALLVVAGAAGAVYGAAHPSVTGTNTDAYKKTSANVFLSETGGTKTTIVSILLPAGQWVITGDATIYAPNYGGFVRCAVFKGSTQLDLQSTFGTLSGINVIGAVKSTSPFAASLKCWDDDSNPIPPDVDSGAVLWAHKSTSLAGL